jgi:hypothetical protein
VRAAEEAGSDSDIEELEVRIVTIARVVGRIVKTSAQGTN